MKKIAVLFANGTEEIEGLTPVDVIRRCGAECKIVSVSGMMPTGSHGITITADVLVDDVLSEDFDAVVIPGGMPGATNISNNANAVALIKKALSGGKTVAAICASPAVVLGEHKLIGNNKATCYPAESFIETLGSAYTGASVEVSGNLITANGPKSAMEFSLAVCKALDITPKF